MKSSFSIGISIIFVLLSNMACPAQNLQDENSTSKVYKTPEEAALASKDVLLEIVGAYKTVNLDIDMDKLQRSHLSTLIPYQVLDFNKVLENDSISSLSEIVSSSKGKLAPFLYDNKVVGITRIFGRNGQWQIVELGNKPIRNELNTSSAYPRRNVSVKLYEVPNLQQTIYGFQEDSLDFYFLNFDQISIKEVVTIESFYGLLRERAVAFQKEFGPLLKEEKLVY